MSITETCICGAVLKYESRRITDLSYVIGEFHEHHKACLSNTTNKEKVET